MGQWLQKLSTVWPQSSCRGHRGQKGLPCEKYENRSDLKTNAVIL